MNTLFIALLLAVGFNVLMFLPAYFLKTDKLTDISYALTFIAIATFGLISGTIAIPALILWLMIIIWAIRLGAYLLIRIRKIGKDKRFDERRENFRLFAKFWLLQGFTVWMVLLPSMIFFANEVDEFPIFGIIGVGVWFIGLIIETVADQQKFRFKNDPENKGKWIESGLWKYSRHPNYFGEILVWVGVYVFTLFGLEFDQAIVGLSSPVFIGLLLIFVSGIPLLEKAADKKWGSDPMYIEYKDKTSKLVLWPRKE